MGPVCLECMKEVPYRIEVVPAIFQVRGLEVKGKEMRMICMECGKELYDSKIHDKNVYLRQSAYLRALRGV